MDQATKYRTKGMASGFRRKVAGASTTMLCKTQQIALADIAQPRCRQLQQTFPEGRHLVVYSLSGVDFHSNLVHLTGIPLPIAAAPAAQQTGAQTQASPILEPTGGTRHQHREQK